MHPLGNYNVSLFKYFRQASFRDRKGIRVQESLKRKYRRWKKKTTSKVSHSQFNTKSLSHIDDTVNGSLTTYETPEKFKKQIRQHTSDCNRSFPESKELKCAIVNHVVGKMFKSPLTHKTMNQIMSRYMPIQANRDRNNSHLVHSLMKIQKYRTARNNVKLLENVSQLKKTYSIHAVARKLNIQYSHLHRL